MAVGPRVLEAAGIPAGPINRISQALAGVQAQHRGMVRTMAGVPVVGQLVAVNPIVSRFWIEGLRIADASVMPSVPSGNCHAGIMMIAERLSDWLKADSGSLTLTSRTTNAQGIVEYPLNKIVV